MKVVSIIFGCISAVCIVTSVFAGWMSVYSEGCGAIVGMCALFAASCMFAFAGFKCDPNC